MNIEEFCVQFGGHPRNINDVLHEWQAEELDTLLKSLRDEYDQLVGCGVIVGDAFHGDGLLDQIPRELHNAFFNLMKKTARTYEEMRQILLEKIQSDDGGFFSFDDHHVRGFISKLKGQIGENIFQRHAGSAAKLAELGNQPAWDVAVDKGHGVHQYIQVKLYADPHEVLKKMLSVQEKVAKGLINGVQPDDVVHHIDFAVPASIVEPVRHLAEKYPELHSMHVLPIPVSTTAAADFVKEGLSNVGPEQLGHFFDELLFGAVTAGSLHAIVNGFLWYKGAKEFSDAFADAAASTAISTTGIGMGLVTETFCHAIALSGAVGIGSRLLLGRLARSRWSFADFLEQSVAHTEAQIAALQQQFHTPEPATA